MKKKKLAQPALIFSTPLPRPRSERTHQLARWFGLTWPRGSKRRATLSFDASSLLPGEGQIVLINGASGSGKSALLKKLRAAVPQEQWIDLDEITLPNKPTVDCFGELPMKEVLSLLSRVGLSEAWTYLRTPAQLSEGQRWRLRLGMGLALARQSSGAILVCDEFAAVLDRVTAAVVSHALRKAIVPPLRAILVTSHDDLKEALKPDAVAVCDFGSLRLMKNAA